MMPLAGRAIEILCDVDSHMDEFGRLLHQQWLLKRTMSSEVSTDRIDQIYDLGLKAGALGGKLLGAGGGGFILFFVRPGQQAAVKTALKDLLYVPARFDHLGSQIIYHSRDDEY